MRLLKGSDIVLDYKIIQGLIDEFYKQSKAEMERIFSDDEDLEFESFQDGFTMAVGSIRELFSKDNVIRLENEIEKQEQKLREESNDG